jgi:dihydroneopterin aldolase
MHLTVKIHRMKLYAHHGVMEQERLVGNDFEVSVILRVDGYDGSDHLVRTVSYADVAAIIRKEMSIPSALIEHVASRIAQRIKQDFPTMVIGGEVTVEKLSPPMEAEVERVGVTVCL